ncbi:MAG TPA: preprotein translocase subunit YajC, partial [Candidatus Aminicenantes bacterium]|nr:preprotein translocase subunit YajC [Candidatus Aminicenantes bacterium]
MILGAVADLARQAGGGQMARPNMLGALLPFVAVFAIFYLLIIMPQRKKQKKHMEMVNQLKPGDRVITTAGIFGTVMGVQKDLIELKIASNTNIKVTKSAVGVIRGATDRL